MAKSIRQLLLENIETTLVGITVANGYNNTVLAKNILRSMFAPGTTLIWPTILISASDEPVNRLSGDVVDRQLTITLTLALGGTTNVLPGQVEGAVADIVKAMAADTTRDGYASEQSEPSIQEPTYSQILEGHAFIKCVFLIDYRTNRFNPTIT